MSSSESSMWMAKSSGMAAGPNGKVIHLLKTPEEDREWHIMATERVRCDFFSKTTYRDTIRMSRDLPIYSAQFNGF